MPDATVRHGTDAPDSRVMGAPDRGDDDNRPGPHRLSGPRPAGGGAPGNFTPGATPGGPLPDRDGQSKKKRNKTARRTVDFQDTANNGRRRSDDMDDVPRRGGRRRPKASRVVSQATQPLKAVKRKIRIEEAIRVADMAHQMGLKSNEIIKVLFNLGIMATINKALDIDTASVVAANSAMKWKRWLRRRTVFGRSPHRRFA